MNEPTKDTNPKDAVAGNKIPLVLLSPIAKAEWSLAQYAGMIKYGAWNWRVSGVRASVYLSAMSRHMDAYLSGEEKDPTDGTHHLGNIMACAAILLDAREAGKLTDDRPPMVGLRSAYGDLETLMSRLRDQYKDKTPRHCTIADDVLPLPPRTPRGLGPSVQMTRTVIHTETPDPEATSETIPSIQEAPRHMTSIPITGTNPDGDPPPSEDSDRYLLGSDLIAPDTLRSDRTPEVTLDTYSVHHTRVGKLVGCTEGIEDAPAAFKLVQLFQDSSFSGDRISVYKGGNLIYTNVVFQ
jgi:hypothetical protein